MVQSLKIIVQRGAGKYCNASDKDYEESGAQLVDTAEQVWQNSHFILKVKQPLSTADLNEFECMSSMPLIQQNDSNFPLVIGVPREILPDEGRAALLPSGVKELLLFANSNSICSPHLLCKTVMTYFHFIDYKDMTLEILKTKCNSIALESITSRGDQVSVFNKPDWVDNYSDNGLLMPSIVKKYKEKLSETLCCLDPMSVVAGIEAVLQGVVYLNEESVKIENEKVVADEKWLNQVLEHYPKYSGDLLKGKTVFIIGSGTCGLSSLYLAEKCGAKIILSVHSNIPRVESVLKQCYGEDAVAVCNSSGNLGVFNALKTHKIAIIEYDTQVQEAFELSCLNIGTAVGRGGKAIKPIPAQVIKSVSEQVPMRRIMMDVAVDNFYIVHPNGYCDEDFDAVCSHHSDPVRAGYKGLIYYMVGNMPGRPGRISEISSLILQESRLPFLKLLLQHGLKGAAEANEGLMNGYSTLNGIFTDKDVAENASFELKPFYKPVEQVLENM